LTFCICFCMILEIILFSEFGFLPVLCIILRKLFYVDSNPTPHNIPKEFNFYLRKELQI
jgi:hypothetical protein